MDKYIKGISLIISSCIIAGAIIYHGQVGRYELELEFDHRGINGWLNTRLIDTKTGKSYRPYGENQDQWKLETEFVQQSKDE
tara:strand:- start:21 stop:266 length:246 start_codon:yes stop_codon:yes gene_type:complete